MYLFGIDVCASMVYFYVIICIILVEEDGYCNRILLFEQMITCHSTSVSILACFLPTFD